VRVPLHAMLCKLCILVVSYHCLLSEGKHTLECLCVYLLGYLGEDLLMPLMEHKPHPLHDYFTTCPLLFAPFLLKCNYGTSFRRFTITFDVVAIDHSPHWSTKSALAALVVAHEFGHVVGLRDRPTNSNGTLASSLMNSDQINAGNIRGLTSFDSTSVRMLYN